MADNIATLADPTNFGNKPGDGPLRQGGVPGEPESDANKPSTLSPVAKAQRPMLAMVRDLWGGNDVLRDRAQVYLPQAPGEETKMYQMRLSRSAFFNAFRRTIDGLVGLVFRKDIKLEDDVPDQIREHWENIDNAGTHGDVFARDIFCDSMVAGHAAILVEFPKTDGTQDAATEMRGDLRPYWVPIKKDDIISWRTSVEHGRMMLDQIVIRETSYVPSGRFGMVERTLYRVIKRGQMGDGTPAVGWALLHEHEGVVKVFDEGFYTNQTEIPISEVATSGRRSMFESEPPLKDLAFLNLAHYQMWSDYNWSIHKTCVPFIFGAGILEAVDEHGNRVPFVIGANTALITPEPQAKMEYIAHSGQSLDSVKAALDDLKSDMGTLGISMLAPQRRAAETAEAKRLDKSTSDSSLAVAARGLQDALERALQFHANYLRLDAGGSVEVNRDFEGLLMDAPVMSAYAQLVNAGFPPMAVLQALQQGGRIGPDEDLEDLEMQWLVGASAAQAVEDMDGDE